MTAAYLAGLAIVVLILGYAARPAIPQSKPEPLEPTISQSEIARLREQVRDNSYQQLQKRFAQVADRGVSSLVWVNGLGRTGVIWPNGRTVLVARDPDALPRMAMVADNHGPIQLAPDRWVPGLPFASMVAARKLSNSLPSPSDDLRQGSWAVLVSRRSDGHIVYTSGTFSGYIGAACNGISYQQLQTSIPLQADVAGSGLFDLDAKLLGVVATCNDMTIVIPIEQIAGMIQETALPDVQVLAHYGMRVAPASAAAGEYFGRSDALVVNEVWDDWPAARAGVLPGDLIVSVDGEPVLPSNSTLPVQSDPVQVNIIRGARRLSVRIDMRPQTVQSERQAGIVTDDRDRGIRIRRVLSGTPEARAGILAGDELIALITPKRRRPMSRVSDVQLPLPAYLVVRRGARRLGLLVTP